MELKQKLILEDFEDEESQEVELTPEETTNFHVGTISDLLTKYLDVYSSLNSLIAGGELNGSINTALTSVSEDTAVIIGKLQECLKMCSNDSESMEAGSAEIAESEEE